MSKKILETPRLILRTWGDEDIEDMHAVNQDPLVMEYFPSLPTLSETKALVEKINKHQLQKGYSLYATILKEKKAFIGFIGLLTVEFAAEFTPAVEIGWRLGSQYWGSGLATEGASFVLKQAFEKFKIPEIVSFTTASNTKSRRVMEKIGLQRDPADDFQHPGLPDGDALKPHVLYKLGRQQYLRRV